MESDHWPVVAVNIVAFVLCVGFLAYMGHIVIPFLRRKETPPGNADDFVWHLIIPCLDEEQVIEGTVRHLASTFPQAVLWVVDDASSDRTPEILAGLADEYSSLNVISRYLPDARRGKGAALNAAYHAIEATEPVGEHRSRVVVGIIDADARLDPHALDTISGPDMFGDSTVGCVQVQVRVTTDVEAYAGLDARRMDETFANRGEPLLVRMQDMEFTTSIAAMQYLRRRTGSVGMGGNGQFSRLSALDLVAEQFETPWHGALLEDFELGLHVLLIGFRSEYCHYAYVAQEGLPNVKPLIRQRSRWAQGGMQCMQYLKHVMNSPNLSLTSAIEIAYYLLLPWTQILGSIIFPIAITINCYYAFTAEGGTDAWIRQGAWALLPLSVVFGMLPYYMWGPLYRAQTGHRISRRRAAALGLMNVFYGYMLQIAVWWAFARILRRRSDWKKTERLQLGHRLLAVEGEDRHEVRHLEVAK